MNWKRLIRPRYSLSMLLFATAIIAAAMKGIVLPKIEAARQRSIIQKVYLGGINVDDDNAYSGSSDCHDWSASDAALAELPKLKQVTSVTVRGDTRRSQRLTPDGLANLGRMPQLKMLHLRGVPRDEKSLAFLNSLKRLEELSIEGVAISDSDCKLLEHHPSLADLHIRGITISSEMIVSVAKIEMLKHLGFYECDLRDADLSPLRDLTKLERLNIWNSSVTHETKLTIDALRAERPGLIIDVHDQ